jgi:hypothetical protein
MENGYVCQPRIPPLRCLTASTGTLTPDVRELYGLIDVNRFCSLPHWLRAPENMKKSLAQAVAGLTLGDLVGLSEAR